MLTSAGCIAVNVDNGCDVRIGACIAVVSTVLFAADGEEDADRTLIPILILVWLIPEDSLSLLLSVTLLQSYWQQATL